MSFLSLRRLARRLNRHPPAVRVMADAGAGRAESPEKSSVPPSEKKYEVVVDRGNGKGSKEKAGTGKKKTLGGKPSAPQRQESVHMTSESTLMDLDDSHIPDGATPFEKQMHERIKAMDRDGDGKITIQERPPIRARLHLARPCPLPEWEQHSSAVPRRN